MAKRTRARISPPKSLVIEDEVIDVKPIMNRAERRLAIRRAWHAMKVGQPTPPPKRA